MKHYLLTFLLICSIFGWNNEQIVKHNSNDFSVNIPLELRSFPNTSTEMNMKKLFDISGIEPMKKNELLDEYLLKHKPNDFSVNIPLESRNFSNTSTEMNMEKLFNNK